VESGVQRARCLRPIDLEDDLGLGSIEHLEAAAPGAA
jgi:hypothetical protein